ncbi:MAG: hypothetical protein JW720_14795 [Sedimentisphaerales bacterium]|nr:hypothetical protein [Sedimentisphaerales bacterium]
MIVAGINGFGRFGLHLLKYWLDRSDEAAFEIGFINDDTLSLKGAYEIMLDDPYVLFEKYDIQPAEDAIVISKPCGGRHVINYTHNSSSHIPWLGRVEMFFECSGKETVENMRKHYLQGNTRTIIVSATAWDADKTLIYGFNHEQLSPEDEVISYGSCTVNAYVPLANFLHKKYGVVDSDVHVIHNTPAYLLRDNLTLNRRPCTLEVSGEKLLDFVNPQNFTVKYTVVPYSGVSMIDLRFRLRSSVSKGGIIEVLEKSFNGGELNRLYGFDQTDMGPSKYNCTRYSAVFMKDGVQIAGDNVYFQGYLDTENSANRFFDLANYIAARSGAGMC